MTKKAVAYHRVSPTRHKPGETGLHSSLEESIRICNEDAHRDGYEIVTDYTDEYISGKSSKEMPQFNMMLEDAKQKDVVWDRIYCRRVNRFGRNRSDVVSAEIKLTELDISLKFVENGIDTGKPFGKSIMAILAELAEQDRLEIIENIRRGRERAVLKGIKFGKPPKDLNVEMVRRERLAGTTWKQLETDLKVSTTLMISRLKTAGYWDFTRRMVK